MLRPLRQHLYGILLKEKGLRGEKVKEWCVEGPDSFNNFIEVDPVPPTGNIYFSVHKTIVNFSVDKKLYVNFHNYVYCMCINRVIRHIL